MTNQNDMREALLDELAAVVDGEKDALEKFADVLADSEEARDLQYEAAKAASLIADAGADYEMPEDLEARVMEGIDARSPYAPKSVASDEVAAESAAHMPGPGTAEAPPASAPQAPERKATKGRRLALVVTASFAIAAATVLGIMGPDLWGGAQVEVASAEALNGRVVTIVRAADDQETGLSVRAPGSQEFVRVVPDTHLVTGSSIRTDERTRAEVSLSDGSTIILNQGDRDHPRRGGSHLEARPW